MTVEQIFESRKNDPRWNTSYPLSPDDWAPFRVHRPLSFAYDKEMSFYVHIPFCKQLCTFCEYTRMICPNETLQKRYIDTLANDIISFKSKYNNFVLKGFDIGGGTPTCLSDDNFSRLLDLYDDALSGLHHAVDYEPSIEGTFNTLSETKLKRIVKSGIYRLSLGVQSTSKDVLCTHHRERIGVYEMASWMNIAYQSGIQKINLDLMYGLHGQDKTTIAQDLLLIERLSPQQVTLYELRTNMIALKDIPCKTELYAMYEQYYEGLIAMGYNARFGQNTFSLDYNDCGVSSYLRSRMLDGCSYKGFGISAQSMSTEGISYNIGKGIQNIIELLACESFNEEFTYKLPSKELASKYIAIAAYNGSFSLARLASLLPIVPELYFKEEIAFCQERGLLQLNENNRLVISQKGFLHYGEVFSLFYNKALPFTEHTNSVSSSFETS